MAQYQPFFEGEGDIAALTDNGACTIHIIIDTTKFTLDNFRVVSTDVSVVDVSNLPNNVDDLSIVLPSHDIVGVIQLCVYCS